jgi:hypothetical protein
MSLAERLSTPPKAVAKCGFASWMNTLAETDRKAVWAACDNIQGWSIGALVEVLAADGCPVAENRVRDHRFGRCKSCGPR